MIINYICIFNTHTYIYILHTNKNGTDETLQSQSIPSDLAATKSNETFFPSGPLIFFCS